MKKRNNTPERHKIGICRKMMLNFCEARLISGPSAKSSYFYLSIYEEIKIVFQIGFKKLA